MALTYTVLSATAFSRSDQGRGINAGTTEADRALQVSKQATGAADRALQVSKQGTGTGSL